MPIARRGPRLPARHPGERTSQFLWRMLVRRPLRRLGFDLIRLGDPNRRQTLEQALGQLDRIGLRPASVVDVGVAGGTPELYDSFPDARFLLIEPVREHEPELREILTRVRGEYVLAAASSRAGTVGMWVSPDPGEAWNSTIFSHTSHEADHWVERHVPAVRIDDVVAERGLEPPFLIKADTEGSELEALRGAERTLQRTEAVILEVNLTRTFEGAPRLAEVVDFMGEREFVAYDIVGGFNRSADGALALTDMVFLREST